MERVPLPQPKPLLTALLTWGLARTGTINDENDDGVSVLYGTWYSALGVLPSLCHSAKMTE